MTTNTTQSMTGGDMAQSAGDVQEYRFPQVVTVAPGAPWRWLRKGLEDFRAAPLASAFYGAVLALMGMVLANFVSDAAYELAFATGFLLVGPFLAMGIYEISRRRESGQPVRLGETLTAWRANVPAIGFYAIILTLLMAVWIRVSVVVVVALFFEGGVPTVQTLFRDILGSENGLIFLVAYLAAGAGFALLVFASSVVSLPMLLDRPRMDTLTAMITSFNALRTNFTPMLLWGIVIVVLTALGLAALYLGLIVVLPLIGHATWHAYREVVKP
ncbi:MAG TPA: DUF2189 domain-containing protein [Burkholderiales bacterium]|nr:DUF2189 domain-containing protein [Burkholderiales bacterium]